MSDTFAVRLARCGGAEVACATTGAQTSPIATTRETVVIGREPELAAIIAFLSASTSTASAAIVEGEPGIGKTTIVRAATELALSSGRRVLSARPGSGETEIPYAALGDLFETVAPGARAALPTPQRDALEVALAQTGSTAPVDGYALAKAVLELVRREAAEGELLIVVDDVQWLDRPTAAALSFALRRLRTVPVQLIAAGRTGTAPQLNLDEWDDVQQITIGPMSPTELGALVRDQLGADLARPRLEELARVSGGNPMFALELARRDEHAVRDSPPTTLLEALDAQLRELTEGPRTALAFAAAALQPSTDLLLRAGIGRAAMRAALATGLVVADGEQLSFVHPLLRTAAYELLLPDERRDVHRRLAAVSDDAVEHGHHVSCSATGPDESAATSLERAAETASALGDHAGAAVFLLRAAELSRDRDGDRARTRELHAANELQLAGDVEAAAELAGRLLELLPPGIARAKVRIIRANCLIGVELSFDAYAAELQAALIDAAGDDETEAMMHVQLAELAASELSLERALDHCRAATKLAKRVRHDGVRTTALGLAGFVDSLLGRDGRKVAAAALAAWDGQILWPNSYPPRMSLAEVCLYAAEFDEAARLYSEEIEFAAERGLEAIEVMARAHLAETQLRRGDWAAALSGAREAHEHARQAADEQIVMGTVYALAMTEALLGDLEAARTRARDALAFAETIGDFWHTTFNQSVLGIAALTEGDAATAVEVLEPAWTAIMVSDLGDLSVFPVAHVLGEALASIGRLDEATAVASALRDSPAGRRPWCMVMAGRIDALVASARGDHLAARAAVAASLTAHAELPEPFEHARTVHVLGRIERRARRWGAARPAFADALTRFDELGAARWAERAASDLAGLPGRRPATGNSLTAREREVAELVASGLSNKEVAARLFVSRFTVEANLSKVYAKLDVHSRAALARALADG